MITTCQDGIDALLGYSVLDPIFTNLKPDYGKRLPVVMENVTLYLLDKEHIENTNDLCTVVYIPDSSGAGMRENLDSIYAQTYADFEILLVAEHGSGAWRMAEGERDDRLRLLAAPAGANLADRRNLALKQAKGKYIFYLDPGFAWLDKYLAASVAAFHHLPEAEAIYSAVYLFETKDNLRAIKYGSCNKSLLRNRNYIEMSSFAHKRSVDKCLQGFAAELGVLSDYDFVLRASEVCELYSVPILQVSCYEDKVKRPEDDFDYCGLLHDLRLAAERRQREQQQAYAEKKLQHPVSAVIANYEQAEDLGECIRSLIAAHCDEIIVVDNASSEATRQKLAEYVRDYGIILIQNEFNSGFSYATNQGMERAKKENDILMVNTDSVYETGAVYEMQKAAYTLPDAGIVLPRQIWPKGRNMRLHVPYADMDYECDVTLSIHDRNLINVPLFCNGRNIEIDFGNFFSVYLPRAVYNEVGPLDAEWGRFYRSDRTYSMLLRKLFHKRIYYIPEAIVYHKMSVGTNLVKKQNPELYRLMFLENGWTEEERQQLGYGPRKPWDIYDKPMPAKPVEKTKSKNATPVNSVVKSTVGGLLCRYGLSGRPRAFWLGENAKLPSELEPASGDFIISSNATLQGEVYHGLPVLTVKALSEMANRPFVIVIGDLPEARQIMSSVGYREGLDFVFV